MLHKKHHNIQLKSKKYCIFAAENKNDYDNKPRRSNRQGFQGVPENELRKGKHQHTGEGLRTCKDRNSILFPHKLDLFVAVADKFFIQLQNPVNKFDQPADTLAEFIDQYVAGVSKAMNGIVSLVNDGNNPYDCCPNFYYIHFLSQVRMYYPGIRQKIEDIFSKDYEMWSTVIQRAKDKGEIRSDVDVTTTARMFRQVFYGISYEHAFLNGLDTNELKENFKYLYSLLTRK